jgi:hypothetical protein
MKSVEMPLWLKYWLKQHRGARRQICRLLHLKPARMDKWVEGNHGMPEWIVKQCQACIELGLVNSNGWH